VLDALPVTKTNSIKALKESQGMTPKQKITHRTYPFFVQHQTPKGTGVDPRRQVAASHVWIKNHLVG